jgi:hypothetical protein
MEQWHQAHQRAYGEDPWPRLERMVTALTRRMLGWDPSDAERIDAEGSAALLDPDEEQERHHIWLPAARLLALALWRAARHHDVLVDEVALTHGQWWVDGAYSGQLFDDPLPPWPGHLPQLRSWAQMRDRHTELAASAHSIALWHLMADLRENRELADTDDGTAGSPLLLGDRYRAVLAGPYRDIGQPRWAANVEGTIENISKAAGEFTSGAWSPGPEVIAWARALHPTLASAPDAPAVEGAEGTPWIQRVAHLVHVEQVARTVRSHFSDVEELGSHPRHPAGRCQAGALVMLGQFAETGRELEHLWEHGTDGVAAWERRHIPHPIRKHIRALERLISAWCDLCWNLIRDPDEHPTDPW